MEPDQEGRDLEPAEVLAAVELVVEGWEATDPEQDRVVFAFALHVVKKYRIKQVSPVIRCSVRSAEQGWFMNRKNGDFSCQWQGWHR